MIRFIVTKGDDITITPWQDEPVKSGANGHTAVLEMTKLRQEYGKEAKIRIERDTVIEKPETGQVRFKVALPNNETRYSAVVPESESEALRLKLVEMFPKGVINRG